MGDLLGGLGSRLGLNLTGLVENILVIGLTVFALALGFFAIRYLGKRRQMQQQNQMAALIKGLHYAGVSRDVFNTRRQESHEHLLRGLRWLFGAGGVSGAMYAYASMQPANAFIDAIRGALLGLVPGAIGLAHLLFSFICKLRSKTTSMRVPSGSHYARAGYYRAAGRRF
jgi:protein-S-isoprenylcysteine O-methyltransferase Ste14